MIDSFYIPSLGRHNNQISFQSLPPKVQDITQIVVQPHEADLYKKNYPILVLPESIKGITETRRWIYMNSMDIKYFVADDDLKFSCRTPNGEKSKRPMNSDDWDYVLEQTDKWLDEFAFGGFRQGNLPPSNKEYLESVAVTCLYFFNGKLLPDESELDWDLNLAEDISMVLQLFQKGYNNKVWDKFGYLSDFVGTEGGCAEWRTLDLINENHQKLINKFPNYVSWNGEREMMGGILKKIKVRWKKCYLDSQRGNLNKFIT